MRPSSRPTGAVWSLLEAWSADHPLRPNQSQMADFFEVSTSLLSNWKYMQSMMQADDIAKVSEKTGISPDDLARAVVQDSSTVLSNVRARRTATRELSERDDKVGHLRAADEQESSISGEQEQPTEP